MKKLETCRRILETKEVKRTIYIAEDGREFSDEQECLEHEDAFAAVSGLRMEYLGRPLDCVLNEEAWDFTWYKVHSMEDMEALERYYQTKFAEADCQDAIKDGLVCIGDPSYPESQYEEPGIYTISEMIRLVTNFMDAAGYSTEIRKK